MPRMTQCVGICVETAAGNRQYGATRGVLIGADAAGLERVMVDTVDSYDEIEGERLSLFVQLPAGTPQMREEEFGRHWARVCDGVVGASDEQLPRLKVPEGFQLEPFCRLTAKELVQRQQQQASRRCQIGAEKEGDAAPPATFCHKCHQQQQQQQQGTDYPSAASSAPGSGPTNPSTSPPRLPFSQKRAAMPPAEPEPLAKRPAVGTGNNANGVLQQALTSSAEALPTAHQRVQQLLQGHSSAPRWQLPPPRPCALTAAAVPLHAQHPPVFYRPTERQGAPLLLLLVSLRCLIG